MFIVVEGNIGAGKSVLIEALTAKLRKAGQTVKMRLEPVEAWRNYYGVNILKSLYENQDYWAFRFQTVAMMGCIKNESVVDNDILITERSSLTCLEIFGPLLCSDIEVNILRDLRKLIPTNDPDFVVYVRTEPKECYKRLLRRGREEEVGSVDLQYIEKIHYLYESLFQKKRFNKLIVVNGVSDVNVLVETILCKGF